MGVYKCILHPYKQVVSNNALPEFINLKQKLKMDWLLPLIAGLLVLGGTGIGLYITYSFRSQSKQKQVEIEQLNKRINEVVQVNQSLSHDILEISKNLTTITKDIKELSEKSIILTDKNITLTEKTIELSRKIENIQTGGDGHCVVSAAYITDKSALLVALVKGEYPLYGVQVRVVDLELFRQTTDYSIESSKKYQQTYLMGDLPPNTATTIARINSDFSSGKKDFNIFFSARNGFHIQHLRLRKINGKWLSYSKVFESGSSKILFEEMDEGFPKKEIEE